VLTQKVILLSNYLYNNFIVEATEIKNKQEKDRSCIDSTFNENANAESQKQVISGNQAEDEISLVTPIKAIKINNNTTLKTKSSLDNDHHNHTDNYINNNNKADNNLNNKQELTEITVLNDDDSPSNITIINNNQKSLEPSEILKQKLNLIEINIFNSNETNESNEIDLKYHEEKQIAQEEEKLQINTESINKKVFNENKYNYNNKAKFKKNKYKLDNYNNTYNIDNIENVDCHIGRKQGNSVKPTRRSEIGISNEKIVFLKESIHRSKDHANSSYLDININNLNSSRSTFNLKSLICEKFKLYSPETLSKGDLDLELANFNKENNSSLKKNLKNRSINIDTFSTGTGIAMDFTPRALMLKKINLNETFNKLYHLPYGSTADTKSISSDILEVKQKYEEDKDDKVTAAFSKDECLVLKTDTARVKTKEVNIEINTQKGGQEKEVSHNEDDLKYLKPECLEKGFISNLEISHDKSKPINAEITPEKRKSKEKQIDNCNNYYIDTYKNIKEIISRNDAFSLTVSNIF